MTTEESALTAAKQDAIFFDIINHLNDIGYQDADVYDTPMGLVQIWWGTHGWKRRWLTVKKWSGVSP